MQLTEQQFKMGETLITKEYTDGKLTKIWIQDKDGVLFSGNTEESTIVLDALKAVLYEEVL